jgi:hypothetical protein
VSGPAISVGFNLIGATDDSSGWLATDRTGTRAAPLDPRLGPLRDNGGLTPTRALTAASPAINTGDQELAGSFDQRGSMRTFFNHDIGAFQSLPARSFRIVAPPTAIGGKPFELTVVALDQWGNTASTYTGRIHFSSSDGSARLPADYTFSGDDQGGHLFHATLNTAGSQTITVNDVNAILFSGTATVEVEDLSISAEGLMFPSDLVAAGPKACRH